MKGYARVWRRLWADEKFRALAPHPGQWVVLYVLSCSSNRAGIFTVSVGDIAERLDLRPADALAELEAVCRAMEWPWDPTTRTVWIPSWWRWNPPESPSALLGYLKELRDIPESSVRESYLRTIPNVPDTLRAAWRQAAGSLRAGSRARAHVGPEPEPDPEPDPEPEPALCAESESDATQGGQAVADATGWTPAAGLLATLAHDFPDLDLDALAADVRTAIAEGRVKHGNGALRAWAKAAARKGTHRRPAPKTSTANGADATELFRRMLLQRVQAHAPDLPRAARDRLWKRAEDAVAAGASENLVLFGPSYLAAWCAEEARDLASSPTTRGENP